MKSEITDIFEQKNVTVANSNSTSKLDEFETSKSDGINEELFTEVTTKTTSESPVEFTKFFFGKKEQIDSFAIGEGVLLSGWKLKENISARLIEADEEMVTLECLIDKENRIYEERDLKRSYFDGYPIEQGQLFKLCWYERKNQVMMEVKNNPKLVLEDDFPNLSFVSKYKNLKVRK